MSCWNLNSYVPLTCDVVGLLRREADYVTMNILIFKIRINGKLLTYLINWLFTPWSRVLLEKLTGLQLVKKFPAFYGTRKFITVLTSALHLSLSWANSIRSPQPPHTSWRFILILSSHLRLGLSNGLFPSGFPTRTLCTPIPSPIRATCTAHLILLDCPHKTWSKIIILHTFMLVFFGYQKGRKKFRYRFVVAISAVHSAPNFFFPIFAFKPLEYDASLWTALIWLGIGRSGWLFWARLWSFWFHKMRGISEIALNVPASHDGPCCLELHIPNVGMSR